MGGFTLLDMEYKPGEEITMMVDPAGERGIGEWLLSAFCAFIYRTTEQTVFNIAIGRGGATCQITMDAGKGLEQAAHIIRGMSIRKPGDAGYGFYFYTNPQRYDDHQPKAGLDMTVCRHKGRISMRLTDPGVEHETIVVQMEQLASLIADAMKHPEKAVDALALSPKKVEHTIAESYPLLTMDKANAMLAGLDAAMVRYAEAILSSELDYEQPLSASQLLTYSMRSYGDFARIDIDAAWDAARFEGAWASILEDQDIMRASIKVTDKSMKVYQMPGKLDIPFVDASVYGHQQCERFIEKAVEYVSWLYRDEGHLDGGLPLHGLVCISKPAGFVVLVPVSNLAFDEESHEILADLLKGAYSGKRQAAGMDYSNYALVVNELPFGANDAGILRQTNLDIFNRAYEAYIKTKEQGSYSYINYTFEVEEMRRAKLLKVAEIVYAAALDFTYPGMLVPVLLRHSGREFANRDYVDCLGDFIDVLPVAMDGNVMFGDQIEPLLQYVRRLSVSHAALAVSPAQIHRYPKCAEVMTRLDFSKLQLQMLDIKMVEKADYEMPDIAEHNTVITIADEILKLQNLECPLGEEKELMDYLDEVSDYWKINE